MKVNCAALQHVLNIANNSWGFGENAYPEARRLASSSLGGLSSDDYLGFSK